MIIASIGSFSSSLLVSAASSFHLIFLSGPFSSCLLANVHFFFFSYFWASALNLSGFYESIRESFFLNVLVGLL
jgi:hypothetical protein